MISHPSFLICCHVWKIEGIRIDSEDPKDVGSTRSKEPGSLNDCVEHSLSSFLITLDHGMLKK